MAHNRKHQGSVNLHHSFDEIWDFLDVEGAFALNTSEKKDFVAKARIATRRLSGKRENVLVFYRKYEDYLSESARCYPCCWGYYYNCLGKEGQRIGMYCKALDSHVWLNKESP